MAVHSFKNAKELAGYPPSIIDAFNRSAGLGLSN
jgi:hypothetical protein